MYLKTTSSAWKWRSVFCNYNNLTQSWFYYLLYSTKALNCYFNCTEYQLDTSLLPYSRTNKTNIHTHVYNTCILTGWLLIITKDIHPYIHNHHSKIVLIRFHSCLPRCKVCRERSEDLFNVRNTKSFRDLTPISRASRRTSNSFAFVEEDVNEGFDYTGRSIWSSAFHRGILHPSLPWSPNVESQNAKKNTQQQKHMQLLPVLDISITNALTKGV